MRYLIIVGVAVATLSCAAHGTRQPPVAAEARLRSSADDRGNAFCFVDGRTASCDDLMRYAPDAVDRIEILKGATAVERYGLEAMGGAILLSTRPSPDATPVTTTPSENIFYFIDGLTASRGDFARLPPDSIQRIEVLKNSAVIARYGSQAVAGAILVTTKRAR